MVLWDADVSDENATGPEITDTTSNPSYWAVAIHAPGDGHRAYAGNSDAVSVELDLASIGDQVWFDVDGNGFPDPGEPPIPNATVTVTYLGPAGIAGDGDDEVHVMTTGGSGRYLVEDLPGGAYTVAVTGIPPGLAPTYDLDGTPTAPGLERSARTRRNEMSISATPGRAASATWCGSTATVTEAKTQMNRGSDRPKSP